MSDPKRWSQADSEAPETLRQGLREAQRDAMPDEAMASLRARLGPLLGPGDGGGGGEGGGGEGGGEDVSPPSGGAPPATGGAAGLSGTAHSGPAALGFPLLVAGGVASVVVGAGLFWVANRATQPNTPPEITIGEPTPSEVEEAAPESVRAESSEPSPGARAAPPTPPRSRRARQPETALAAEIAEPLPPAAPPPELELVTALQQALAREPTQALGLAEDHARYYPAGRFVQEREIVAIQALLRLGRHAEATDRARRFRRSYPGSGYLRRLDALDLDGPP